MDSSAMRGGVAERRERYDVTWRLLVSSIYKLFTIFSDLLSTY